MYDDRLPWAIAVILIILAEIIGVPLLIIWAVNLFVEHDYAYDFWNWAGVTIILVVLRTIFGPKVSLPKEY